MKTVLACLFAVALLGPMRLSSGASGDDSLSPIMEKGDALEAKLETQPALDVYLSGEKAGAKNAELLRRIARQYGELMADTDSAQRKRELGEKALDYARRAVAADAKNALAQLSLAVCYGRLAPLLDSKTKIAYSKLVKEHAEKSRALDPENDLTYHVLGAWNYELAVLNPLLRSIARMLYGELPPASLEKAADDFRHAIQLNPRRLANHVELGRTLAAMGATAEARKELQIGLEMPNREKDDPGTKERAREALQKL